MALGNWYIAALVLMFAAGFTQLGDAQTTPNHPPQFQVPVVPNPLGQPLIGSDGYVRPNVMLGPTALRPEDKKYADYSGAHMKEMVQEIANLSIRDRDSGTVYWGRNIGTLGHTLAEDWTMDHLKKLGLSDVHKVMQDIKQPQWMPHSYDINFVSDGHSFKLPSARPSQSLSTPAGGLDLELIWAGLGSEADFAGKDVKGKAVLIQDIPLPGDINHTAVTEQVAKRAFAHGAAAVGLVFGITDNFSLWQRTDGKYGFNLGFEDGMKLRDMLNAGKSVHVQYKLDAEIRTSGVTGASVFGTLPGASDEQVIIVAHMDGYFEAALDNASGLSMMIAMAEHYAKIPRAQRARTIVFVGSVGHHSGPGTLWLHQNVDWKKVAWVINLEHVAVVDTAIWGPHTIMATSPGPLRWALNASPTVEGIVMDSLHHFQVPIFDNIDDVVGEIGSIYHDAPSLTLITSPLIKHTEQDTPEWVPAAGLENVARAHSRIIDQLGKLPIKDIEPGQWPASALVARGGGG